MATRRSCSLPGQPISSRTSAGVGGFRGDLRGFAGRRRPDWVSLRAAEAVPALTHDLADASDDTRRGGGTRAARSGTEAGPALPALLELYKDPKGPSCRTRSERRWSEQVPSARRPPRFWRRPCVTRMPTSAPWRRELLPPRRSTTCSPGDPGSTQGCGCASSRPTTVLLHDLGEEKHGCRPGPGGVAGRRAKEQPDVHRVLWERGPGPKGGARAGQVSYQPAAVPAAPSAGCARLSGTGTASEAAVPN